MGAVPQVPAVEPSRCGPAAALLRRRALQAGRGCAAVDRLVGGAEAQLDGRRLPTETHEEVFARFRKIIDDPAVTIEAPPGIDPLAADAPLIFSLSPLVGTPLTTSAKFAVVAKSPLTGRLNDALNRGQPVMRTARYASISRRLAQLATLLAGRPA